MANRYWVGGTANWSSSNTTNWSTTSGGLGGASVPGASDSVFFDTLSNATAYTVTITNSANCLDFTMGAPLTGKVTWAGFSALNIRGSMSLSGGTAGITNSYSAGITFSATVTGKTIDTNGVTFAGGSWTFSGAGGGWTLQNDLSVGTFSILHTAGALDFNGYTITADSVQSTGALTRTLTLGVSSITVTNWNLTGSNLTFSGASSTITMPNSSASFNGLSQTFGTVNITGSAADATITGSNTFTNLNRTGTATQTCALELAQGTTQIVSGTFTATGNSLTNRLIVGADNFNGGTATIQAAAVSLTNVDFSGLIATGAASWSGSSVGNAARNTGITFTSQVTRYAVSAGNWSSTGIWSTSSGGSSGASVPLCHDIVIIDGNSGVGTITQDVIRIGDITFTGYTGTYANTVDCSIYGSIVLATGMTFTGSGNMQWRGDVTQNVTSTGKTFPKTILIRASGGSVTFVDNFVTSGTFTISPEVNPTTLNLSADGQSTTFVCSTALANVINFNSGTWSLTGTGTVWNMNSAAVLSLTGSTITLTNTSNTACTFTGGSETYGTLWFQRGASTGNITVSGSNSFQTFRDSGTAAHSILFTAATTQTITSWLVTGNPGALITINSTTTGVHNLVKSGGGVVSANYLNIQHSVATPATTWYAGANSTNNQAVSTAGSGWTFTFPPASPIMHLMQTSGGLM